MKKYDWKLIADFCKDKDKTRRDVCEKFGCDASTLQQAIRYNRIDKAIFKKGIANSSPEARKRISDNMKRLYSEGKHPGWSHINRDKNRRSYPEKVFFKIISNNDFFKQFKIEEKLPFGKYYLDFALIDKKIDIEIDGNQHFLTEKAIQHDKERDKFLNDNGWTVYRILWMNMSKDIDREIKELVEYIQHYQTLTNRIYTLPEIQEFNSLRDKCECGGEKIKVAQYCWKCYNQKRRKFNIAREDLEKLILQKIPLYKIGKMFGVSGLIVKNRILEFGIPFKSKVFPQKHP